MEKTGKVQSIYRLDGLDNLSGLDALRKLHVLIEERARFTSVRDAKVTVLDDIPVLITYKLTEEEEELRRKMLQGAHGYWRGGAYHLTYAPRRRRRYH